MAVSVKISQLNDGGSVNAADYLPVARGGADTFKIPASQFVIGGQNVGVGSATIFKTSVDGSGRTLQFRSLSGSDGINVVNAGDTLVVSASGQNPVKTSITGNGSTTTYAVNGAISINPNNYRVDIDGVLQEPLNDYTIVGSNIVFNPAPPNGSKVTVVSNNLVRAYDIIPSDGSVTTNKIVDRAVTSDKIALSGVDTANINNGAITEAKIADSVISFAKLAASSKILASGSLAGTTDVNIDTSFTISQPGWLIVTGNCTANYSSGSVVNAGNYAFIYLDGTASGNIIATDGMFEGESATVNFYSNAVGMAGVAAGTHTLRLNHTVTAATRIASRLSWVVFPI